MKNHCLVSLVHGLDYMRRRDSMAGLRALNTALNGGLYLSAKKPL
ncbi:MAG: hypothetical protein RRC34_04945 [Lentisphaeria bacterium]|nr:hypothetical protein [Lentisphaeria bacterium]